MKFPACPYCQTKYSCKALAEIRGKRTVCRYCGKQLSVSRRLAVLPVWGISMALMIFNLIVFLISEIRSSDLMIIIIANAVTVFSALLTAPLMLQFDKNVLKI